MTSVREPVTTWKQIDVCQGNNAPDGAWRLRMADGNFESISVSTLDKDLASKMSQDSEGVKDPSLDDLVLAWDSLDHNRFNQVCRGKKESGQTPLRYPLFGYYKGFGQCNPIVDKEKHLLVSNSQPVILDRRVLDYLVGKFPVTMNGCTQKDGENHYVMFSAEVNSLKAAIASIEKDIANSQIGFDIATLQAIRDALAGIVKQSPEEIARKNMIVNIAMGIGNLATLALVVGLTARANLKLQRQIVALQEEMKKIAVEQLELSRKQVNGEKIHDALKQFGDDFNEMAKKGEFDHFDSSVVEQQLERTRLALAEGKSDAFVGPPGRGKSVAAKLLARGIARGDYPELKGVRILELDLNRLVGGTRGRGDFEARLQAVIDAAISLYEEKGERVVFFVDELHRLIGTGSAEGILGGDQTLKPYLADGRIVMLGATTRREFDRYIAIDGAMADRFAINEFPALNAEETFRALSAQSPVIGRGKFIKGQEIQITNEALLKAIELAARKWPNRFDPRRTSDLLTSAVGYKRVYGKKMSGDPRILTAADVQEFFDKLIKTGSDVVIDTPRIVIPDWLSQVRPGISDFGWQALRPGEGDWREVRRAGEGPRPSEFSRLGERPEDVRDARAGREKSALERALEFKLGTGRR